MENDQNVRRRAQPPHTGLFAACFEVFLICGSWFGLAEMTHALSAVIKSF